jgi:hypothetical protein
MLERIGQETHQYVSPTYKVQLHHDNFAACELPLGHGCLL